MKNIKESSEIKYAIYCRKSSEEDNKQILSIDSQRQENLLRAERQGLKVVCVLEESKSASKPGREKFNELMTLVETGKVQGVICWALDRLARNPLDEGALKWLFQQGKLKHINTGSGDHYTGDSILVMGVHLSMANQFVLDLKKNVRRGQEAKAQMGWPHGVAHIGFLNEKIGDRGDKTWKVDPERFALVEQILRMYLTGNYSASQVADYARVTLKLTTPVRRRSGGKLISRSNVYQLLKNPIYAGFFHLGGKRYELHQSMPRIITEEEYISIQRRLSGKSAPRNKHFSATYSGFITSPYGEFIGQDLKFQVICECKRKFSYLHKDSCPSCGKVLGKINNPKYLQYTYYYNMRKHKAKEKAVYVEEKIIDEFLAGFIEKNLQLSPALVSWSKKYLHELKDKELEQNNHVVSSQKTRKESLERKKRRYREMLAEDLISPEDYRRDIIEIDNELKNISFEPVAVDWLAKAEDIVDLTLATADTIRNGSTKAKRAILARLGSNLVWDEEKLSIINTKPIQVLIDAIANARLKYPTFEPRFNEAEKDKTEAFASVYPVLLRR